MGSNSQNKCSICIDLIQAVVESSILCLQHAVDTWHYQTKQTIKQCAAPNQCPKNKKPSAKNKACQECIAWVKAIEDKVYPQTDVGTLQWRNVNPTVFHNDPLEVIKLFVLRIPAKKTFSDLADFDAASLLMIMSKFKPFHGGDQDTFEKIKKVFNIRNSVAHFKVKQKLQLDHQTFGAFFTDIDDLVDGLKSLKRQYFTQQTADELRKKIIEIKTNAIQVPLKRDSVGSKWSILAVLSLFLALSISFFGFKSDTPRNEDIGRQQQLASLPEALDGTVRLIAGDLRKLYLNSYCKKQMYPWKPGNYVDLDKVYVPVTIDITIPGMRPIKERLKSYHEIFESNEDSRYILAGSPGQGKSTFCAKLAFDWCQESSPLKDVKLLFIVQLAKIDHSSDIEDVIRSQLFSKRVSKDVTSAQLGEIISYLGKQVVIVLDGLDEAPPDLFKYQNYGSLVEMIKFEQYRDCCVLVTTRPWREKEVTSILGYRRLELQKMKRSDVKAYIAKLFGQNIETIALGKRLLRYIDENRLLLDCSTPLMTLLISWYWAETNGERGIPDRISKVYEDIVTIMCDNFMKTNSGFNVDSFLQEKLYSQLGKLSLNGLTPTTTKIVFTEEEIKKACGGKKYSNQLRDMGILCSKGSDMLQFFHKSGQEFFAGKYLQNYPKHVQSYMKGVTTIESALNIASVLVFASRSKLAAKIIVQRLMEILQSTTSLQNYYEENISLDDFLSIQRYIELCLDCNFEADAEGELVSILRYLFMDGKVKFHGISSKTALAVAYFMRYCDWEDISSVTLRPVAHVGISDVPYGLSLNIYNEALQRVKYLGNDKIQEIKASFVEANPDLHENWITEYAPTQLAAYIPCIQSFEGLPSSRETNVAPIIHSFKFIKLHNLNVNDFRFDRAFSDLIESIDSDEMSSLQVLNARAAAEQQVTRLASKLHKLPLLQVLDISANKAEAGRTIPILAENLHHLKLLQALRVSNMRAPADDMEILARNLPLHMTRLTIEDNDMSDAVATHLIDTLPQTLTLLHTSMHELSESKHDELLQVIHTKCIHLQILGLWHSPYPSDLMKHAGLTLMACPDMKELILEVIPHRRNDLIPGESVDVFIEGLQQANKIGKLRLYDISLDRKSFYDVLQSCKLKHLTNLRFSRDLLPEGVLAEELDEFVILV